MAVALQVFGRRAADVDSQAARGRVRRDDALQEQQVIGISLCWLLDSSGGSRAQHTLDAGSRPRSPRCKRDEDRSTRAQR